MKSQTKTTKKPLVLASEKLRPLADQELTNAEGGGTVPKSLPNEWRGN